MNIVENLGSAFGYIKKISSTIMSINKASNGDLVSYTKAARVEPITMVDNRLQTLPYLTDVLQTLSSIMAAYFVQAVSLTTHVSNVDVLGTLDKLNPTRDVSKGLSSFVSKVKEKAKDKGILNTESYVSANLEHYGITLEDDSAGSSDTQAEGKTVEGQTDGKGKKDDKNTKDNQTPPSPRYNVNDINKTIHDNVNLAVGKIIQVQVGDKDKGAVFPVSVRLLTNLMDPSVLIHILGDGGRNVALRERWHGWRSGELQFWRDLVLCTDLIDEHRRALAKDQSGVYADIMKRRRNNAFVSTITQTPSVATASNMLVVSKRLIQELERHVGNSWNSPRMRNKVFDSTYLMVVAVVDPDREMVYFYHRGIDTPSQLSIREIKVSNGKGGPDIMEIMDSLLKSRAPSF